MHFIICNGANKPCRDEFAEDINGIHDHFEHTTVPKWIIFGEWGRKLKINMTYCPAARCLSGGYSTKIP